MALVCLYEFQSLLGVYSVQLPNYFSDWKNNSRFTPEMSMYSAEPDQSSRQFSEVCELKESSTDPKALKNAYILISALYD